jgi:hypothetical protein
MTIYLPSLTGYGPGQTIPVEPVELKEVLRTRYTEPADIVPFGSNIGSLRLEETGSVIAVRISKCATSRSPWQYTTNADPAN